MRHSLKLLSYNIHQGITARRHRLGLVALLGVAGAHFGARAPALSPSLAFLAVAALLGAIFHLSRGALP